MVCFDINGWFNSVRDHDGSVGGLFIDSKHIESSYYLVNFF